MPSSYTAGVTGVIRPEEIKREMRCLLCQNATGFLHCKMVTGCAESDVCFVERIFLDDGKNIINAGCRSRTECTKEGCYGEAYPNKSQTKTSTSVLQKGRVCHHCCDGDLCNLYGCPDEEQVTDLIAPMCLSCKGVFHPSDCRMFTQCPKDHVCGGKSYSEGRHVLYELMCIEESTCSLLRSRPYYHRRIARSSFREADCCYGHMCNGNIPFVDTDPSPRSKSFTCPQRNLTVPSTATSTSATTSSTKPTTTRSTTVPTTTTSVTVPTSATSTSVTTATASMSTPKPTSFQCMDKYPSCTRIGPAICTMSKSFALSNCAAYCKLCGATSTTSTSTESSTTTTVQTTTQAKACIDDYPNCWEYGKAFCTDPTYRLWIYSNCRKWCGVCTVSIADMTSVSAEPTTTSSTTVGRTSQVPSTRRTSTKPITTSSTTVQNTIQAKECIDDYPNCWEYGKAFCTDPTYKMWIYSNCRKWCGVCTVTSTTSTSTSTSTEPSTTSTTTVQSTILGKECKDENPDCFAYGTVFCTDPTYSLWIYNNCKKWCGFCTEASTATTAPTTAGTPQTTTTPPTTTTPVCEDKIDCSLYYPGEVCHGQFLNFGKENCSAYCGFCKPPNPPPCKDAIANCDMYKDVCANIDYWHFRYHNCRLYCNDCQVGQVRRKSLSDYSIYSHGTPVGRKPTPRYAVPTLYDTVNECVDLMDCTLYYPGEACFGKYHSWAQHNCRAYCGFCTPSVTVSPASCVDTDPDCGTRGADLCTNIDYWWYVYHNCRAHCNLCTGSFNTTVVHKTPGEFSTVSTLQPRISVPPSTKITAPKTATSASNSQNPTDVCRDMIDCTPYYPDEACTGAYLAWAKHNCPAFCGFCNATVTAPPEPCVDKDPACATRGADLCTNVEYWWYIQHSCRSYCNLCTATVNSGVVPTLSTSPTPQQRISIPSSALSTPPTTISATQNITLAPESTSSSNAQLTNETCRDLIDCTPYYPAEACTGAYLAWAKHNCPAFCGFCNVTVTASPEPCIDKDPVCSTRGADLCTNIDYWWYIQHNCRAYCQLCSDATDKPSTVADLTTEQTTKADVKTGVVLTNTSGVKDDCKDLVDCTPYHPSEACFGPYVAWAKHNCPAYCGFCKPTMTTSPEPCIDKDPACFTRGADLCTNIDYWWYIQHNCRLYCNLCSDGPATPGGLIPDQTTSTIITDAPTDITTPNTPNTVDCMDLVDCTPYYPAEACGGAYLGWAKYNCPAYCGFCTPKLTTVPGPCVDVDQECATRAADLCTNINYWWYIQHNCRAYCKLCPEPISKGTASTVAETKITSAPQTSNSTQVPPLSSTTSIPPHRNTTPLKLGSSTTSSINTPRVLQTSTVSTRSPIAPGTSDIFTKSASPTPRTIVPIFITTNALLTTPAEPCVNKISNCNMFGDFICTDHYYLYWTMEHCRKHCNMCRSESKVTSTVISNPRSTKKGNIAL